MGVKIEDLLYGEEHYATALTGFLAKNIINMLSGLNPDGLEKLKERAKELLEVPRYKKGYKPDPPAEEPEEEE